MKYSKIILPLFAIGVFVSSNINFKASQATNAWRSYKSDLGPEELETTFISENIDSKGSYCYKFHVKNISEFYISDFNIYGEYQLENGNIVASQHSSFSVENDIFDYKTLLIGPNQEVDVDFTVKYKFSDLDQVVIGAIGYNADETAEIATDVSLTSNVLSRDDKRVYLDIQNNDQYYNYCAILKTTIDNEEYYFAAFNNNDYIVYGNYAYRCNDDLEISLVKVIKIPNNRVGETIDDSDVRSSNHVLIPTNFLLVLFWPIIAVVLGIIVIPAIVGICILIRSIRNKRKMIK